MSGRTLSRLNRGRTLDQAITWRIRPRCPTVLLAKWRWDMRKRSPLRTELCSSAEDPEKISHLHPRNSRALWQTLYLMEACLCLNSWTMTTKTGCALYARMYNVCRSYIWYVWCCLEVSPICYDPLQTSVVPYHKEGRCFVPFWDGLAAWLCGNINWAG